MRQTQRVLEMTIQCWREAVYCAALAIETRGEAKICDPFGISDPGIA